MSDRLAASGASAPPGVADIARIAAMGDRVLRNLEITHAYAGLSRAMRLRTGTAADWCTFATWASRQAGSTIRGEDLVDRLQRHLGRAGHLAAPLQSINRVLLRRGLLAPETRLGRVIRAVHTPFDAFERASEEVAAGNLKVFEEIGHEFARFVTTVPVEARADSDEFLAFASQLRPGPPPDGQDYLREAFIHYLEQRHDPDAASRAASTLLANLKIGLHEQTRLQPQIAAAMDAGLNTAHDLADRVLHVVIPSSRRWPQPLHRLAAALVGPPAAVLHRASIAITRQIVTEAMMVLAFPNGVLALGRNLEADVPLGLRKPSHPALVRFVAEHDPCGPEISECGADNWSDLGQRMHYILHLFRAYSEEPSLFASPFSEEQMVEVRSGRVPRGDL